MYELPKSPELAKYIQLSNIIGIVAQDFSPYLITMQDSLGTPIPAPLSHKTIPTPQHSNLEQIAIWRSNCASFVLTFQALIDWLVVRVGSALRLPAWLHEKDCVRLKNNIISLMFALRQI